MVTDSWELLHLIQITLFGVYHLNGVWHIVRLRCLRQGIFTWFHFKFRLRQNGSLIEWKDLLTKCMIYQAQRPGSLLLFEFETNVFTQSWLTLNKLLRQNSTEVYSWASKKCYTCIFFWTVKTNEAIIHKTMSYPYSCSLSCFRSTQNSVFIGQAQAIRLRFHV